MHGKTRSRRASVFALLPVAATGYPISTICESLTDTLGGTCSPIPGTDVAFELLNLQQGISFQGRKFGDEHWGVGEISPRNLCLLAVYGGTMPASIVQPSDQSFGSCCAMDRSTQGSYWFEPCHMGEATPSRGDKCPSTPAAKHCTNYAVLEPGDVWATQMSTGAVCYDPPPPPRTTPTGIQYSRAVLAAIDNVLLAASPAT